VTTSVSLLPVSVLPVRNTACSASLSFRQLSGGCLTHSCLQVEQTRERRPQDEMQGWNDSGDFFPRTFKILNKSKRCTGEERTFFACPVFFYRKGCPPVHLPPQKGGTASQGLSLNRSQYGGCSTKYNTPAGTQVVHRRFGGEQAVFPESSHYRTQARAVA
jgi:hypothetical protein